jgi:DNA-binding CsgD family transcriptional regulator
MRRRGLLRHPNYLGFLDRLRAYTRRVRGTDRGIADITRTCHAGLDAPTLLEDLLARLKAVVPFEAGFIATTDPGTLLFTSAVLAEQSHVMHLPGFLANEYLDDDVLKYSDLARGPKRDGTLNQSTRGELAASPRYRQLLAPMGLGDEFRAAFVAGGSCWGVGCLSRERGDIPFGDDEAAALGRLGPHIAEGLRTALLFDEASGREVGMDGPGVLILSEEDLSVLATTPATGRWLEEIAGDREPRLNGLPSCVLNVVAALRSLESQPVVPRVRVRSHSGRWLVLHASYLSLDPASGSIAVVIEPAQRSEVAPLILQAHGLTERESAVVRLVLVGASTKEIAGALSISEHTVQDHFKSIFNKVGVSSRRDLVVRILNDRHPGFEESLVSR